jgi:MiaB-like tRNA modifying enzyme
MNIYLEVYGCTANKSDAAIVKGIIHQKTPHQLVDSIEKADLFIILTCTVIATTEQRMISKIKQVKKMGKKIIISGCMAAVQKKKLTVLFPDAFFLPPQQIHHIPSIIDSQTISSQKNQKYEANRMYDSIIASISIAEGCQFCCHYCITCKARGKLHSFPMKSIYETVETAVQNGCKEIQLTAQDTASYGMDIQTNLGELLQTLSRIEGNYKIRIGMMNPRSVLIHLDSIIQGFTNSHVYTFLHLPVQSGDNQILQLMNRGYQVNDFNYIVDQFRSHFPQLVLSTDIIVGYPSETTTQFQSSLNLLQSIKPDVINITRFSARPGTKAKTMNNRIPTDIVKQRSRQLSAIAEEITAKKNEHYIGMTLPVLITQQKTTGSVIGRASNYKPVVIKETLPLGKWVQVKITDSTAIYLSGILK